VQRDNHRFSQGTPSDWFVEKDGTNQDTIQLLSLLFYIVYQVVSFVQINLPQFRHFEDSARPQKQSFFADGNTIKSIDIIRLRFAHLLTEVRTC
jgi:hypothetical protein